MSKCLLVYYDEKCKCIPCFKHVIIASLGVADRKGYNNRRTLEKF